MGRRDRDDRPPIELWGVPERSAEAETRVRVAPGRRPWRSLAVVALLGVAVAAVLTLDGGDAPQGGRTGKAAEREDPDEGRTTTTRPRSTTTSTTTSTLPPGPVLGHPVGATVVFVGAGPGGGWNWVDLDTGAMGEVDLGTRDAYAVVPVRGGLVVSTGSSVRYVPLTGEPVELQAGSAQVVPTERPDAVWLVEESGQEAGPARLVDLTGRVLRGPLDPRGWVSHGTSEGLVHQRGGRIYLTDGAGTRAIGTGDARSRGGRWLVAETCDDLGRCGLERFDLLGEERPRSFGPTAGDGSLWWTEPSPTGDLAVLVTASDHSDATLSVVALGGEVRWEAAGSGVAASEAGWLPDGSGFVALDRGRAGGVLVSVRGDGVIVEPLPSLSIRSAERILVVPH